MPRLSDYRAMWLITMFDLPVDTKAARYRYTQFRKRLIEDGFIMMQYSVYVRHCASLENAEVHIRRVGNWVPSDGEVRLLTLTEKQHERMQVFVGKRRIAPEYTPNQLELL